MYLGANNLYGHYMIQVLPIEILDWVNSKDFNLDNYSNDSRISCLIEVDLDYPDELYDLHNDYPLAGENIKVQIIEDTAFCLSKNKKLILVLGNRRNTYSIIKA